MLWLNIRLRAKAIAHVRFWVQRTSGRRIKNNVNDPKADMELR